MPFQIAIDGPAASGKSTVARRLAERLRATYVNTGDMYRAVSLVALHRGVDPRTAPESVAAMLPDLDLDAVTGADGRFVLRLNGRPIPPEELRAPRVTAGVSYVARVPEVREWMAERQRAMAALGDIVMEGRDIGTVIFPEARFKFFLTASAETRARRRLAQAGESEPGATVESVAREIRERDRIDSTRALAPLRPAEDAVTVDTSDLDIDQVVDRLWSRIQEALPES